MMASRRLELIALPTVPNPWIGIRRQITKLCPNQRISLSHIFINWVRPHYKFSQLFYLKEAQTLYRYFENRWALLAFGLGSVLWMKWPGAIAVIWSLLPPSCYVNSTGLWMIILLFVPLAHVSPLISQICDLRSHALIFLCLYCLRLLWYFLSSWEI